jgi:hypothetical protein
MKKNLVNLITLKAEFMSRKGQTHLIIRNWKKPVFNQKIIKIREIINKKMIIFFFLIKKLRENSYIPNKLISLYIKVKDLIIIIIIVITHTNKISNKISQEMKFFIICLRTKNNGNKQWRKKILLKIALIIFIIIVLPHRTRKRHTFSNKINF